MNSLNQIILEGNVCRKPEKRVVGNGFRVCTIPLAVDRRYKNQEGKTTEEVSYFEIDAYGNLADACEKWCPTGRGIRVVGHLKQERWKSEDGKSKSKVKVIAEHVEFKFFNPKDKNDGPESAALGTPAPGKKQKLAKLAEAAAAAQKEQAEEEVVF
ncbi:MAG: single-stranded DNA-binding protein [Treponema sp.]|nr:single-stranded DNA-binding protein [Treponema sp.]